MLSFMPRNGACLLASSPDIQQTDDTAEAGAKKQKGTVQQRRNLPHIYEKNREEEQVITGQFQGFNFLTIAAGFFVIRESTCNSAVMWIILSGNRNIM